MTPAPIPTIERVLFVELPAFRIVDGALVRVENRGHSYFEAVVDDEMSRVQMARFAYERVPMKLGICGIDLERERALLGIPTWFLAGSSRRARRRAWAEVPRWRRKEMRPDLPWCVPIYKRVQVRGHRICFRVPGPQQLPGPQLSGPNWYTVWGKLSHRLDERIEGAVLYLCDEQEPTEEHRDLLAQALFEHILMPWDRLPSSRWS